MILQHEQEAAIFSAWGPGYSRFIPYVGPWIGALFPIAFALAFFPGWLSPLLVIVLFVVLELTTNMVLEPIFYGNTAGVSEVAFFSFVHQKKPDLICIGALPPAALSRSQHLKAGLQNEYPDEQIVIGPWGLSGSTNRKLLRTMGVEYVGTPLAETRLRLISAVQLLLAQRGIISQSSSDRQSPSAAQLVT